MAQPAQVQVQVSQLTADAARRQMAGSVERNRRGELQSITITIPLLGRPNSYLVTRLPAAAVQQMESSAAQLPADQRRDFIIDWLQRNRQAVIEQYFTTGRTGRSFNFTVVPLRAVGEAVPRRVEPPPQLEPPAPRVDQAQHRLIEVVHVWNSGPVPFGWQGTIPPGWRAPRPNDYTDLPQEVRVRANVLRPRSGPGQVPMGDGRVEEYNGRRYMYLGCYHTDPQPTHESITVLVPDENAQPRLTQLPPQITGGTGTTADPYLVSPQTNRGSGEATNTRDFRVTMPFGTVVFRATLSNIQLLPANIEATRAELITLFTAAVTRKGEEARPRVDTTAAAFTRARDAAIRREVAGLRAVAAPRAETRRQPTPRIAALVPAPESRVEAPPEIRTRNPIQTTITGGSGSESNPYIVTVPVLVPGRSDAGAELATNNFSFTQAGQEGERSTRSYFRLRFVVARPTEAAEPQATTLTDLSGNVASTIARRLGIVSGSSLRGPVMSVIRDSRTANIGTLGPYIVAR